MSVSGRQNAVDRRDSLTARSSHDWTSPVEIVSCFSSEAAYEIRPGEWPSASPAIVLCVLLPADRKWLFARADNTVLVLQSAVLLRSLRAHRPSTRTGNQGIVGGSQEDVMSIQHTQKRQRCDRCGGRFGLVTHRWWGNKFCKRTCRDNYIRDRDAICRWLWFGRLPS